MDYSFVTTVANNMKRYHRREVDRAKKAGEVYVAVRKPSRKQFYLILTNGWLNKCPITVEDAKRYFEIYGNDVVTLRGKMSKKKGSAAPSRIPSSLSPDLLQHHGSITLCIDIFYVQGIPFFHSISRKIHFRTACQLTGRSKALLLEQVNNLKNIYHSRGFTITDIKGDGEFRCLEKDLLPAIFDPVAADDHVNDVERSIRTIKDDIRTLSQSLPFKCLPRLLVSEMVNYVIRCRNMFPDNDGVSDSLCPLSIIQSALHHHRSWPS